MRGFINPPRVQSKGQGCRNHVYYKGNLYTTAACFTVSSFKGGLIRQGTAALQKPDKGPYIYRNLTSIQHSKSLSV